jgi:hypothetical protein
LGAQAAVIDVSSADLGGQLCRLDAELVIHTAGPFQGQDYAVAKAAAKARCHYIDLADGRRFVCDFADAMRPTFEQAGCFAVSGASTLPALSNAVVDALAPRFRQIKSIHICIAPAQQAPRGQATMAAVLQYCGAPVNVWQGARWQTHIGWANPAEISFAHMPPRLAALCDVPDLELLPQRYPGVHDVTFRAALELPIAQRGMAALAWLRQQGLLARPARWANLLNHAGRLLEPFGSALGGMVVRVQGLDLEDQVMQLAWHISADHNHGPEIPCMAAVLLARRLANAEVFEPGASTCAGHLKLEEFMPLFKQWGMKTECLGEDHNGSP